MVREFGRSTSPSIATLQKILTALGTDLAAFFASDPEEPSGPVFLRQQMRTISGGDRSYTIVFPKRRGIVTERSQRRVPGGRDVESQVRYPAIVIRPLRAART